MSNISSQSTAEEAPSTSIVRTRKAVENFNQIDLVGNVSHQISGAKLPSNRQVLQVLFYNMRYVNLSAKLSAKLTIDAVEIFWHQARIPIRQGHKCVDKLLKLYEVWKKIQKTVTDKRSNAQKQAAETFIENLDELFNIATLDALDKIRIVEDRQFLLMQRQKGRPGCMLGVDMALWYREKKAQERKDKEAARKRKHEEENTSQADVSQLMEWTDEGSVTNLPINTTIIEKENLSASTVLGGKRGRKTFITARLVTALDNAKVFDGMAVHILIAAAEALGHRVEELVINRSTIHRLRQENRIKESKEISAGFTHNASKIGSVVAHFDGKFMKDLIGSTKVERIAILVSYNGTSKFLGAPKVESSTGKNIADAVYERLVKWNIVDQVKGLSYDTTSTNTGINTGAAVLLEKRIGRGLINLPCRHHVYEIILRSVFETKLYSTSAPEVSIFERFAKSWPSFNKELFRSGNEDAIVCLQISPAEHETCIKFCYDQLHKSQTREDYKELLQLVLMFLGAERYNFRTPGPTSHARWMSKAIYSLKIFLFRDQYTLTKNESNGLRDICIFLVKLYIKVWFRCTNAIDAALQDLTFIQDAIKYSETDPEISAVILKKISNHLWYISEETVALGFFDPNISFEEKRKMVENLKLKEPIVKLKNGRYYSNLQDFKKLSLCNFVSEKTKYFFSRFGLPMKFLDLEPSTWETSFEFEEGWTFCKDLFVLNDTAERGVKFIQDYNRILTNDEEEKQLLLQVVEAYRQKYPSYKKSDLILNP